MRSCLNGLTATALGVLLLPTLLLGQAQENKSRTADECCGTGVVTLPSEQLKKRLEHFVPISPPSMREKFQVRGVLVFGVGIDDKGSVKCLHLISGHPLIVGSAVEAVKQWTFKPTVIEGHAKPSCGLLILRLAANERRVDTTILEELPKANGGGK